MNHQNVLKLKVAEYAFAYLKPQITKQTILGVGTGSTVNFFIAVLAEHKHLFKGAVASSVASGKLLHKQGIQLFDLNEIDHLDFYIDGADEVDPNLNLIKGGGGALTREKIMASSFKNFICVCDQSKQASQLGNFPLPVEVIPMARNLVTRELIKIGGEPQYRTNCITDNGNLILDVKGLDLSYPASVEMQINNIAGVVCNGIFALRRADILLVASNQSVQEITNKL